MPLENFAKMFLTMRYQLTCRMAFLMNLVFLCSLAGSQDIPRYPKISQGGIQGPPSHEGGDFEAWDLDWGDGIKQLPSGYD